MLMPYRPEPFTDFSRPEEAQAFAAAVAQVGNELGRSYPLIIAGQRINRPESIVSYNPSNSIQVVGCVARGTLSDAADAIAAAVAAFPAWSATPAEERARVLFKAAAIMRRRKHTLSAWLSFEVGKNRAEADGDTAEAIDFLEYYGREAIRLGGPQSLVPYPGEENKIYYRPLGVGVVHSPFNFPLAILCGMLSAAVVAGNTVVAKPSTEAPVIASMLFEILAEAGLPAGVANILFADPIEVGQLLTTHKDVRFINFTGSRQVGCEIYEKAAKVQPGQIFLRRVIAEMGGKDAIIVDETADIEAAADGIVTSAFGYSGQKCSACSRVIITDRVYDRVATAVVERARALAVGPATDPETQVGPVAAQRYLNRILDYIEVGKSEGRLLCGGNTMPGGFFIQPTVFGDVSPSARIAREEIFGPVLALIRATDFEAALAMANDTEYGLTGGLYTQDRARIETARKILRVGNLYVNRKCTGALVGVQPFGGFNMSGTDSKAGGPDYLALFTQAQVVTEKL